MKNIEAKIDFWRGFIAALAAVILAGAFILASVYAADRADRIQCEKWKTMKATYPQFEITDLIKAQCE